MEKKQIANEIDGLIVTCAISAECDERRLRQLAVEYADFRCQYQLHANHIRSLETQKEKKIALDMEQKVNDIVKKTISAEIDGLIVSCAISAECDEHQLRQLAVEYAKFNSPYQLHANHMRSLETKKKKKIALDMERKVNDILRSTKKGGKSKRRRSMKNKKRSRIYK